MVERMDVGTREASLDSTAPDEDFQALAERWRRETGMFSSVTKKVDHPAYQRIIAMGATAVPLILRELAHRPGHWFEALRAIVGESPVPADKKGDITKVREAWLEWGRGKGYI